MTLTLLLIIFLDFDMANDGPHMVMTSSSRNTRRAQKLPRRVRRSGPRGFFGIFGKDIIITVVTAFLPSRRQASCMLYAWSMRSVNFIGSKTVVYERFDKIRDRSVHKSHSHVIISGIFILRRRIRSTPGRSPFRCEGHSPSSR